MPDLPTSIEDILRASIKDLRAERKLLKEKLVPIDANRDKIKARITARTTEINIIQDFLDSE